MYDPDAEPYYAPAWRLLKRLPVISMITLYDTPPPDRLPGERSERPQMTTKEQRVERWLSQLSNVEFENQRLLDDDSLRLIAEVRQMSCFSLV